MANQDKQDALLLPSNVTNTAQSQQSVAIYYSWIFLPEGGEDVCIHMHMCKHMPRVETYFSTQKKPLSKLMPSSFVPACSDRFAPSLRETAFGYHCL